MLSPGAAAALGAGERRAEPAASPLFWREPLSLWCAEGPPSQPDRAQLGTVVPFRVPSTAGLGIQAGGGTCMSKKRTTFALNSYTAELSVSMLRGEVAAGVQPSLSLPVTAIRPKVRCVQQGCSVTRGTPEIPA